ncbi:MAG: hypothetical protein ACI4JW_02225 [Oscillospiraceae bacterium]
MTRVSGGEASPLYANHVKHDDETGSGNFLKIISNDYLPQSAENIDLGDYSGVIGEMKDNAQLELNFTNYSDKDITGSGDVGLLCGTMGANSSLTAEISAESNSTNSVTSTGGNAGGLVGSMADGSSLTVKSNITTSGNISATSASKYAGGLVGSAENAAVNFFESSVTVVATVSGGSGSGGVFGYYENGEGKTFNVTNYNVNCTVNGDNSGGNAGGIFGELQNNGGTVTIDSTNSITVTGYGGNFGGLVGLYNAKNSSDTLDISGLEVTVTKSGTATNYGGVIGATESNAYVKCSGVTVNASNCNDSSTCFGGFIGSNGGGMLEVENLKISVKTDDCAFKGGGVVGNMTAGVLQLSGTTDLSSTKCDATGKGKYGQIVGIRGNQTLIYALNGWTLIRSTNPVQADDIGTWGEVLRFSDRFDIDKVLVIKADHTVTVKNIPVTDTNAVTVSSVEKFAIVALNLKAKAGTVNDSKNALRFSDYSSLLNHDNKATLNMTLTSDIDLTGTGITGLYRDDGSNAKGNNGVFDFKGSIIGEKDENENYPTITLAAGEPYGKRKKDSNSEAEIIDSNDETDGNGRIYNHRYSGLISKIYGYSEFKNFNINGIINIQSKSSASDMFVGSVAAQSVTDKTADKVIFENVNTDVDINVICKDNISTRCGGLIGELYFTSAEIKITGCKISSDITISNTTDNRVYAGGVFGNILASKPNLILNIENSEINAVINNKESTNSNYKKVIAGGLIANIAGNDSQSSERTIKLNNVTLDGVEITNCNGSALLGSTWCNVDVTFGGVSINNCKLTGGNSDFAGLVTQGSGYWQVNDVDINNITVSGESGAGAFGMFVNKGYVKYNYTVSSVTTTYYKNLYLEFTSKDAYKISDDTINLSNSSPKFDEILVYANSDTKIAAANGDCAVVSIRTTDPDGDGKPYVIMDGENCNTYQNQTEYAKTTDTTKKFNPYVRYYYNLDYIRGKSNKNDAEKLLLWSVNRYAHESIKSYFEFTGDFIETTTNEDGSESEISTIPAGEYDMKGYSYYPVDIDDTVNIEGPSEFTFYNNEFDTIEGKGDSRFSYNTNNQHYLMQSGLFRDCSGSLTVNDATFSGNAGKVFDDSVGIKDSGVLIRGKVAGTVESPAKIVCNNIVLDGIIVNGAADSSYAPLLINQIDHDANLTINGISTTAAYNEGDPTKTAAGCLIGNVGFYDYNNANNIKLVFNNIKLDSRAKRFDDDDLNSEFDTAYNTKKSIFKNATILNAFSYPEGNNCSAIYNYKYSEDWDKNDSALHNVTYGKEITASIQYKDLERNYLNSPYYTDPKTSANDSEPYNFDNDYFLPYVKPNSSTTSKFYEIKVNVATPNLDKGCGTYNDPYIIEKANQLMLVADILGGVDTFSDGTVINYRENNYNSWCAEKTDETTHASHCMYVWDSATSKFYPPEMENGEIVKDVLGNPVPDTTGTAVELDVIKDALSTAYYQLSGDNDNIILSASFTGLGKTTPFMGVIDGNNKTITNQSVNPLIYNSTGSVVKDLTVNAAANSITLAAPAAKSAYDTDGSGGTQFYGGLIGIVNGGDNIIDNVSLSFGEETKITVGTSNYSGNVAVGGYIGVVRYGGVVFRNMSGASKTGLTSTVCSDVSESSKNFLYINPIIGRVIDGFAVTESDNYNPHETAVTMKNGTKNYSIADIDKDITESEKLSFSENGGVDYKITVPDSQSLFMIGCITNSGAGKYDIAQNKYNSDYNLFGYGKTNVNQMVRHGSYVSVGSDTKTDFESNVKSGDCFGASVVPYLIYKYTEKDEGSTCEYPVRTLTSNTAAFYISLVQNGNYDLPDGFRGIGSVNDTSDSSQMYIHGIDGNGSTVNMNIQYQLYNNGTDYYDTENSGIGLFNTFCQNGSSFIGEDFDNASDKYKISNLTLSGNVVLKRYNYSGNETTTNNGTISAGGLGGSCNSGKCTIQLENISLNGLTVSSTYNAGGLIGTAEPEATATASLKCISADGLSVTAARQAGGFVGYSKNITYTVDGKGSNDSNSSFKINTIELTDTDTKTVNESQPVPRAAGGLFGLFQENASLDLSGMDIEKHGENGVIELKSGVTLKENCLGGIIGYMNNCGNVKIDGCNVKNINIQNGSRCGGLIGIVYNKGAEVENSIEITNSNLLSDEDSEISSSCPSGNYANSGGLCGYSNTTITIDGCSVEGYTISSERSEGCAGFVTKSDGTLSALNSLVKDCTLKQSGTNSVGAFLGCNGGNGFKGYNLVSDNVQMTNFSGNALSSGGDIVGNNNNRTLQLVGVSVQKNEDGKYASQSVGGTFTSSNGYVIYSDYNRICLSESANTEACEINRSETADVTYSYPYATINPKTAIDSSMFLTSDGAGGRTTIDAILADTARYKNVTADRTVLEQFKDKVSTFNTETGAGLETDFPVLVVNDSKDINVTKLINSYIHIVTNDSSITNYAAESEIYKVEISRYRMNNDTKAFEEVADGEQSLKRKNGVFGMSNKEYDTDHTQFTLLDVQYLAPNDTEKVAYHLYIPVLVEKLLKYDFKAEILSGTNYRASDYEGKKAVMESYGSPVTVFLEYSYQRTVGEWQTAIDLGENLLGNYGKTVLLTSGNNNHLPDNTELVLVDRNNYGRPYYSTVSAAVEGNLMSFDKFSSSGNVPFTPLTLLELLERSAVLSAAESEEGKYIVCDGDDENALVKVGETYYKLKPEGLADGTAYEITIKAKDNSLSETAVLPITESYYISFFTPKSSELPMVDITVQSAATLDNTGMKTPSHVTSVNSAANMIFGDLYEQEFILNVTNADVVMTESNNSLTASLESKIKIKDGNETVKVYLRTEEISLYHGFNIDLNITDESGLQKGVKGNPYVTGSYIIGSTSHNISETCTGSSIELYAASGGQMVDISKTLADSADGIKIMCNEIKITYDPSGLMEQFPLRPDTNNTYGVSVSASSNLAYTPESVSHSTISEMQSNDTKYYRQGEVTVAQLNYNIPTGTIDADEFSKLGVNGNEPPENITAVGYYDVSEISDEEIQNAQKVSVTLSLLQKNADGGYVPVDNIKSYLENIRLYGNSSDASFTANGNTVSAEFLKDELVFENNIFEINTGYTVITGSNFEAKGFTYSNYKVLMTVSLLYENGDPVTNSSCSDHIIYTNARIYTEFLNPSE